MLSAKEISNIKAGVRIIKSKQPNATVDMIFNTFMYVFGKDLNEEEVLEAKKIIEEEYYGSKDMLN
jgi:hypothetical protein